MNLIGKHKIRTHNMGSLWDVSKFSAWDEFDPGNLEFFSIGDSKCEAVNKFTNCIFHKYHITVENIWDSATIEN